MVFLGEEEPRSCLNLDYLSIAVCPCLHLKTKQPTKKKQTNKNPQKTVVF